MNIDLAQLTAWKGKSESRTERISATPARCLAALLNDRDSVFEDGCELPPAWQWLHFLPCARRDELGCDGHPKLGGFMPPIPLPRRMWAAGKMSISRPLCIGDEVTRMTRIDDIISKDGRNGPLIFLKLRHDFATTAGVAITEEQDLVYRGQPDPSQVMPAGKAAPTNEVWREDVQPDPVFLFRYSALTFNAHRIHYDRDYAVNCEHYPALVVHGPLIATLILELLRRGLPRGRRISEFQFRAVRPTFVDNAFSVCAGPADPTGTHQMWSRDHTGTLTMEAMATSG
jgi:3-methylfumaryl-CoA hydratase